MEMEKEEQKHVEVVVEKQEQEQEQEEEEEEEITLLLRKSRTETDNGRSENNGHVDEVSLVTENGAKIEDGIEQKMKEVLENDSEAENGEQKSEDLVFYDKIEGVEYKSTYSEDKQIEKDTNHDKLDITSPDFIVQNSSIAINNKHEGVHLESSKEIESVDDHDMINEDELEEETGYDVENVVQKQNTHDLFCPNCNSCITRRVILRKRKRRIRVSDEEVKRNKIEDVVVQESNDNGDNFDYTRVSTTDEVDEHNREEPDVFRCLSCFSFFIPNGNRFRFPKFGKEGVKENVREERVANTKKNWFTSMFPSTKQETSLEQGTTENNDTLEVRDEILNLPRQEPAPNGKEIIGTTTEKIDATNEQFKKYPSEQLTESKSVQTNHATPKKTQITNGVSSEDTISFSQDGLRFLISSNNGSLTPENSKEREISSQTLHLGGTDKEGKLNISVGFPHEEQQVGSYTVTESVVENKSTNTNFTSSETGGQVYSTEVSQHTITKSKYEHSGEALNVSSISSVNGLSFAQGKDSVITIDTQPAESTQTLEGIVNATESASPLISGTQIRERTDVRKEFRIEIIKSVVYGGLAESITSLSVVSSAAGGKAATLNILALGMANIIGGLFIICHNLWELRCDRIEQVNNQISNQVIGQRDRYKELLGRRDNFVLHVVVSILSYLIFGLVPPLVYGFSFRKNDDKELKLMVVAAASLLCIMMLAIGRAYIQRPPKRYFKCVLTFVILGFMVSGVSYAGGVLIERLLEKLHLFEPTSVSGLLLPEMTWTHSAWASN